VALSQVESVSEKKKVNRQRVDASDFVRRLNQHHLIEKKHTSQTGNENVRQIETPNACCLVKSTAVGK